MKPHTLSSSQGLLSLLHDTNTTVVSYGLLQLNIVSDEFWPEISDHLVQIELLYEDEGFEQRKLAALLLAKIYFHLSDYSSALQFALASRELFDWNEKSEFVYTMIAKAIDRYIELRRSSTAGAPDLELVVQTLISKSLLCGDYKLVIGIALECRRYDWLEQTVFHNTGKTSKLLNYVLKEAMTYQASADKQEIYRLAIKMYSKLPNPDYLMITHCLIMINEPTMIGELVMYLIKQMPISSNPYSLDEAGKEKNQLDQGELKLFGLQIAFDLLQSASPDLVTRLVRFLGELNSDDEEINVIVEVLGGKVTNVVELEFLVRNNHTDLSILKTIKTALDSRSSLYHTGLTISHALMELGTTQDKFLRLNLEWLSRATNWTKFSATAQLGLVHRGNWSNGFKVLKQYLGAIPGEEQQLAPVAQATTVGAAYSESGALFGLGLIHSNHADPVVRKCLLDSLNSAAGGRNADVVQHGAALGLGITLMGAKDGEVYDALKHVLFTDSAVAGEAASIAMGLIMIGTLETNMELVEELLAYARETKHEKIVRGIAIAVGLFCYGIGDKAYKVLNLLMGDKEPFLRYAAVLGLGLAFVASASNTIIEKLLHSAVSDVDDDVRRAAMMSLGFVLMNRPNQITKLVQLLAESYNPNVRYGASFSLAIACANTADPEAVDLLTRAAQKDPTDFVRQGALVSLAFVVVNHATSALEVREMCTAIVADKHEDSVVKYGASIALGVLNAGGRNLVVGNGAGNSPEELRDAAVGFFLFSQSWFWFPLSFFVHLCFKPALLCCVDGQAKVPRLECRMDLPQGVDFDYPEMAKELSVGVAEKVATAVLSTSAKSKSKKRSDSQDTSVQPEPVPMDVDESLHKKRDKWTNFSRVLPDQLKFINLGTARYQPIKEKAMGYVVCRDLTPTEVADLVFQNTPTIEEMQEKPNDSKDESHQGSTQPPGRFEYEFED